MNPQVQQWGGQWGPPPGPPPPLQQWGEGPRAPPVPNVQQWGVSPSPWVSPASVQQQWGVNLSQGASPQAQVPKQWVPASQPVSTGKGKGGVITGKGGGTPGRGVGDIGHNPCWICLEMGRSPTDHFDRECPHHPTCVRCARASMPYQHTMGKCPQLQGKGGKGKGQVGTPAAKPKPQAYPQS